MCCTPLQQTVEWARSAGSGSLRVEINFFLTFWNFSGIMEYFFSLFRESQTHIIVMTGRDLKDHSTTLPYLGTPSSRPGY